MATLNIRNLPGDVHRRLRVRAAQAGRSMEAEARAILTAACTDSEGKQSASALQSLVDRLYGADLPRNAARSLIDERRRESATE